MPAHRSSREEFLARGSIDALRRCLAVNGGGLSAQLDIFVKPTVISGEKTNETRMQQHPAHEGQVGLQLRVTQRFATHGHGHRQLRDIVPRIASVMPIGDVKPTCVSICA
jgi:hypothetical protein